ncbi:MAG: UbiA family prenyltransferase [Planctomycetes bacterium]|nr:UbiA family prenyltransferase [Planctomycetota bacterium]
MSRPVKQLLAWCQLLRIGNVFTAASNVIAGFLIAQGGWQPVGPLLVLIAASALLYVAGMVLNDAFDAERDATEHPERPIPSGRISRRTAFVVGWTLLAVGCLVAIIAANLVNNMRPAIAAGALALCIVGYDAGLKSTFLGPWTMGTCRLLNVMLGVYGTSDAWLPDTLLYAVLVGLYTVGVTYFARTENEQGCDWNQYIGSVMVLATTFCASIWAGRATGDLLLVFINGSILFLFIWCDRGWFTAGPATPSILRGRVRRMILGFIVMDAVMVYATVGWQPAVVLLSLLLPTWIASRFAPMT